jgi:transcriptional regulator with XRE-family HTH domain
VQEKSKEILRTGLRLIRRAQNLTLRQLATRSGVGASTIGHFETGHIDVSSEILQKLAEALRVSIDDIRHHAYASVAEEVSAAIDAGPEGAARRMEAAELVRALEKYFELFADPEMRHLRRAHIEMIAALAAELARRDPELWADPPDGLVTKRKTKVSCVE